MRNIKMFIDDTGKIKQLPIKEQTKRAVLAYLSTKFSEDRDYTEKEVNTIIDNWHTFGDYFLLRRELIDFQYLCRTKDGRRYWKEKKVEEECN